MQKYKIIITGNDINLAYQVSLVPGEEEMTQVFMDGTGHGTSVASLIAANDDGEGITGINSNVDIYSYRVLDDANEAPVSRVIEAIYMAIDQDVKIINMSFGMVDYSEALEEAIHAAKEAGILVIAAAGNTGEDGVQYPAAYEEVMAVGAVNKDGTVEDYSAKGDEVEIVAPGELVRTTGFIDSEEVTSGTSLAAPQVTAVATLIWQKDLSVSADFVRGLLNESANLYGKTDEYGNGLVDIKYAMKYYDEYARKIKNKNASLSSEEVQHIPVNIEKITTYEDTGCVEGCWTGKVHEEFIGTSYYCVRKGARFPDKVDKAGATLLYGIKDESNNTDTRVFAGMTINPWWHGYYTTNYIKAVIYATHIAEVLTDNSASYNSAISVNYGEESNMKKDIEYMYTKKIWSKQLDELKTENSDASGQKNSNQWRLQLAVILIICQVSKNCARGGRNQ